MGKFKFGDLVRSKIDGLEFKVVAVSKVGNAFYYLHKNVWLGEEMVEIKPCETLKAPECSPVPRGSIEISIGGKVQSIKTLKKLYAYRNHRSTKITHYEYEWAGNQFATRCPENDIVRHA